MACLFARYCRRFRREFQRVLQPLVAKQARLHRLLGNPGPHRFCRPAARQFGAGDPLRLRNGVLFAALAASECDWLGRKKILYIRTLRPLFCVKKRLKVNPSLCARTIRIPERSCVRQQFSAWSQFVPDRRLCRAIESVPDALPTIFRFDADTFHEPRRHKCVRTIAARPLLNRDCFQFQGQDADLLVAIKCPNSPRRPIGTRFDLKPHIRESRDRCLALRTLAQRIVGCAIKNIGPRPIAPVIKLKTRNTVSSFRYADRD